MEEISREFHNRRCRVYTVDLEEPLRGIVAVSQPTGAVIMVGERAILRPSITRIELDEPAVD